MSVEQLKEWMVEAERKQDSIYFAVVDKEKETVIGLYCLRQVRFGLRTGEVEWVEWRSSPKTHTTEALYFNSTRVDAPCSRWSFKDWRNMP